MKNGWLLIERHWNNADEPGNVGGFQYFERKDNERFDERIG